jgi:hypothetical protein
MLDDCSRALRVAQLKLNPFARLADVENFEQPVQAARTFPERADGMERNAFDLARDDVLFPQLENLRRDWRSAFSACKSGCETRSLPLSGFLHVHRAGTKCRDCPPPMVRILRDDVELVRPASPRLTSAPQFADAETLWMCVHWQVHRAVL